MPDFDRLAERASRPSAQNASGEGSATEETVADERSRVNSGPGRMLVAVYGLFALAATGRSIMQISESFHRAPVPYLLSALAALIYIVATVALARGDHASTRLARATITFELVGVLFVGLWSVCQPSAFPDKTVWSHFGQGYGFVPLILPIIGLWWLRRTAGVDTPQD